MPRLMKNGEFAAFCRTTKDTLIHYDRAGILKPALVTPAGYRLYRTEQFFLFSMVSLLQQADMPLAAVRGMLEDPAPERVMAAVRERQQALREKIERLQAAQRLLAVLTEEAERVLAMPEGTLVVEERGERRLRVFDRVNVGSWTDETSAEAYAACIDWDMAHSVAVVPPSGEIIPAALVKAGRLVPQAVFTRENGAAPREAEGPVMKTLPAGRWAVMRRRLTAAEAPRAAADFLSAMKKAGLAGVGDLYLFDEFNYLFPGSDPERFELVMTQRIRGEKGASRLARGGVRL